MTKKIKLFAFYLNQSNNKIELVLDGIQLKNFTNVKEFIDYLLKLKKIHYYIYTFDYKSNNSLLQILKYVCNYSKDFNVKIECRGNSYYEIRLKQKIIFRNLFHILNESIINATKLLFPIDSFIDFDKIELTKDVLILYLVLIKANEWFITNLNLPIYQKRTIPSLAFYIFKTKYYNIKNLFYLNDSIDSYIRKSYFGGTAEIYRQMGENIYHYDINSFYPFIMKDFDMPIGCPVWTKNPKLDTDFGFFRCQISVDNLFIPLLEYRNEQHLICPIGTWEGVYFSEELKYAQIIGYKINLLDGFKFKKDKIFTEYVNDFFKLKTESKKDSYEYHFYKLILNSIYGWFGMKKNQFFTYLETNIQHESTIKNETVNYIEFLDNDLILVNATKQARKNFYKSYVQIASAITSYSRIYLHKYKIKYQSNLFYSDTDSLFLNCKMDSLDISEQKLGYFKFVSFSKIAIFIKAKTYYLRLEDGKEIKKGAGYNTESLTFEDYKKFVLYDNYKLSLYSQKRNQKMGFFDMQIKDLTFLLEGGNNRREKYENITTPKKITNKKTNN